MKNYLILLLFNLICLTGSSQSNIRLNNYWENTYYINPASMYSAYKYVASVAGRKQWIGFPGAPDTEYITFAARFNTKKKAQIGQIGLKAFRDYIGFTKLINISPSYSYSLRLNDRLLMNFGIAYKIQNFSYDMSRSNPETKDDPAIYMTETKLTDHNADFGVEFVSNSFVIGAASQNLMSLFTRENSLQTNSNFLYIMHRYEIDDSFNLLPGICVINNENLYQIEFKISALLSSGNPQVQIGAFYRTGREFGVLFGMDLGGSMHLACSYDYDVGGISHSSFGTPELILIWKFSKIRNCECSELFK